MRRYIILASILSIGLIGVFFLVGCGDVCAPPESTITIEPASVSVTDSYTAESTSTQHFTISVKDKEGMPLNDVKVWISFMWANPNDAGVVQLYDGDTPKDSPFWAKTDENGVYVLRFDLQSGAGLTYTGDVEVRSCDAFGTATVTVSASSTTTEGG